MKNGFALLVVMACIMLMSMLGIQWWKQSGLHADIANTRVCFYQYFYYTEIGLNIGVLFARENFSLLTSAQNQKKLPLVFPVQDISQFIAQNQQLPKTNSLSFVIDNPATLEEKTLLIKAILTSQKRVMCVLRCLVRQQDHEGKQVYGVDGFTLGTVS